jgi:hypothetical protein
MENSLFDRTFRDDEGNVVLAQPPNLPLLTWVTATGLKLLFTSGSSYTVLDAVAFGSIFTWAWLELFEGVNYFRRTLGLITLVIVIALRVEWQ